MSEFENLESVEPKKMNTLTRVVGIIVKPGETFEAIRRKPTIWIPMVILLLLPALYYILMWDQLEPGMIVALEEQSALYGTELTPEILAIQIPIMKYTSYATGITFIIVTLITAVYYLIANSIADGDAKFSHLLSMSLYINMISLLSFIVMAVVALLGMESTTPVTSLASLLPVSMSGSIIYAILATVEVFNIWGMILAVKGLQIVANMSKRASIITVALSYGFTLALVIGSVVLAKVFSGLA